MGWDEMAKAGAATVAQLPFVQGPPARSHPPALGQVLGTLAGSAQSSVAQGC